MRIALVEPSSTNRTIISRILQNGGHEVRSFEDGPEALKALATDLRFGAVITGSELRSISGLEFVWQARLLSGPRRFLYVLFMSSLSDDAAVSEALDLGADDFISKPPSPRELYARLRAAERIAKLQSELIELAFTDPLTGLLNRRGFFEAAVPRITSPSAPISGVLVDLDFLKEINDLYGHETGDIAIRALAGVLRKQAGSIVGRVGGDEFGLLLPAYDLKAAAAWGETIRKEFAASRIKTPDGHVSLTCSVGVSELLSGESIDDLLARADLALYKAKDAGRDRVAIPPSREWVEAHHPRMQTHVARSRGRPNNPPLDEKASAAP